VDIAGSHSWSECMRVLDKGATYVGVGAAAVQHGKGGTRRALTHLLGMKVRSSGSGRRFAFFIAELETDDLKLLAGQVESGSVKPVIETTYELSGVPEALRRMEEGHLRAKLAIAVNR